MKNDEKKRNRLELDLGIFQMIIPNCRIVPSEESNKANAVSYSILPAEKDYTGTLKEIVKMMESKYGK